MNNKICFKCKIEKPITEFKIYNGGKNKGYFHSYCKPCYSKYIMQRIKKIWSIKPWLRTWVSINNRCTNKLDKYYKKGIKNLLSKEEIESLWIRDKAFLLKRPSIDRINSDGNYVLSNCRFIELSENSRQGGRKMLGKKRSIETCKRMSESRLRFLNETPH